MTFEQWLSIGYYFLAFILVFSGLNVARSWVRVKKENNDLKNFELKLLAPNNTDGLKLLDALIADTISDYVLLNRSSLNIDQGYINSEEETKIIHDVAEIVSSRISPILLSKLEVYYSQDSLAELISNKTYIQVTAYIVSVNAVKSPDE